MFMPVLPVSVLSRAVTLRRRSAPAPVPSLLLLRARRAPRLAPVGSGSVQQARSPAGLVPATIALVGYLPEREAGAVVGHRASGQPADIILITESSTNGDLRNALATLMKAHAQLGSAVNQDVRFAIRSGRTGTSTPDVIDWGTLRTAPVQEIPGIGPARAITVKFRPPSR